MSRTPSSSSFDKLKRFLESCFPEAWDNTRLRWHKRLLLKMIKGIAEEHGLVVQSGPFQGMKYLPEMLTSEDVVQHALLAKILGSDESELHGTLTSLLGKKYERIISIGCSEGYYSIGTALRFRGAQIFAFDTDPHARKLCERMARLNGVADRVTVEGECSTEHLRELATGSSLVICDCEGCEIGVLRPDLVPGLRTCDLIVELHDCYNPEISRVVPDRFHETHKLPLARAA